jgi:hypothetical protein
VELTGRANPDGFNFWIVDDIHGFSGEARDVILLGSCVGTVVCCENESIGKSSSDVSTDSE